MRHADRMIRSAGVDGRATRGSQPLGLRRFVPAGRGVGQAASEAPTTDREIDLICRASDYRTGDGVTEPAKDDVFHWNDVTGRPRKAVAIAGATRRAYSHMDGYGVLLRVHCREKPAERTGTTADPTA